MDSHSVAATVLQNGEDLLLFAVEGPNSRPDYHVNTKEVRHINLSQLGIVYSVKGKSSFKDN